MSPDSLKESRTQSLSEVYVEFHRAQTIPDEVEAEIYLRMGWKYRFSLVCKNIVQTLSWYNIDYR